MADTSEEGARKSSALTDKAAEEDLDFEITLGTRRDAASDAGSDDGSAEPSEDEEGFLTGNLTVLQGL